MYLIWVSEGEKFKTKEKTEQKFNFFSKIIHTLEILYKKQKS